MFCPYCGTTLPDDARFCGECGAILEDVLNPEEAAAAPAEQPAAEEAPVEAPVVEEAPAEAPVETIALEEMTLETPVEATPLMMDLDALEQKPIALEEMTLEETVPVQPAFFDPAAPNGEQDGFGEDVWTEPAPEEEPGKKAKKEKKVKQPKEKKVKEPKEKKVKEPKKKKAEAVELDENGMPRPKKKKRKGLIITIILILVLLLAGGGFGVFWYLTTPPEETVVQSDFAQHMNLGVEETLDSFVIDQRDTDRWNGRDTIECSVVTSTEDARRSRQYVLEYYKTDTDEDGWALHAVKDLNEALWITEPLAGADIDVIMEPLLGMNIPVTEEYIYPLGEMDLASAKVTAQDTDLNNRTDKATVLVAKAEELYSWTVEVTLEFEFVDSWELKNFQMGDVELEVDEDKAFDLTDEEIQEAIAEETMEVEVDDEAIKLELEGKTIRDFTVEENVFVPEDSTQKVTCTFGVDTGVSVLEVEGDLIFFRSGAGWMLKEVDMTAQLGETSLDGQWVGSYTTADSQKPALSVTITTAEDGTMSGKVAFAPSDDAANFAPGECTYTVSVEYDEQTGKLVCTPNSPWQGYLPYSGMTPVALAGTVSAMDGTYSDESTFTVTIQIPEEAPAEAEAPTA